MNYSFSYKYLKIKNGKENFIIECSYDTMLGKKVYAAKTNLLFKDEFGDWGHACGVGKSEEEAVNGCCNEINEYINTNFTYEQIKNCQDDDLLKKIVIEKHNKPIEIFYKQENNNVDCFCKDKTDLKTVLYACKMVGIEDNTKTTLTHITEDEKKDVIFDTLTRKYNNDNVSIKWTL